MSRGFPLYTQHDVMDCGPTCLRMIAAYYGQHYSAEFLDHESPQISSNSSLKAKENTEKRSRIWELFRTFASKMIKPELSERGINKKRIGDRPVP